MEKYLLNKKMMQLNGNLFKARREKNHRINI